MAGLVVAGCAATAAPTELAAGDTIEPSAAPPAATIRPLPTPFPVPTRPTYGNGAPCPAITALDPPDAEVELQWETVLGWLNMDLTVERTASLHIADEVWVGEEAEPSEYETLRIRGADDMLLQVEHGETYGPVTLAQASAVLRTDDGGRERFAGEVLEQPGPEGELVRFTIPDVGATGYLDIRLELVDGCFAYVAHGLQRVRVASTDFVATCPSDSEGFTAYWTELNTPPMRAGAVPVRLGAGSTMGRWTPYGVAADPVVGYLAWEPESAVASGLAGRTLRMEPGNAGLHLDALRVEFYRRGRLLDWQDGGRWPRDDDVVFRTVAKPFGDGHFDLLLPAAPGRYVASIGFNYDSRCASGYGAAALSVDVAG